MEPHVVLVSMPWTTLVQPSLGLATLQSELQQQGIRSTIYHANIDLLRYVSAKTYDAVAECWGMNDFVFTGLLDDLDRDQLRALQVQCAGKAGTDMHPAYPQPAQLVDLFLMLRNAVMPRYVGEVAERILAMAPTMVGFTCMFDQTIASVAVATLLKEAEPDLLTVLGGYAVQHDAGEEVMKAFACIDAIARGDGEPVIGSLAQASVGETTLEDIPGVLTRAALGRGVGRMPRRANLARNAPPDFADWYGDVARLERDQAVTVRTAGLPVEGSRGCWWGQKSHCVFCGIDEETLRYRAKPADQILVELSTLADRYGADQSFRFSDYILPHGVHESLLPRLAERDPRLRLEAEMKANQTKAKINAFAAAGFESLQPGVESFSSQTLKRMRKGVRGIHNVQLLKWAYESGIVIDYNILYGLPGDTADEYRWLVTNTPRLYHLTPPISRTETIITRFAPLQQNPEMFGIDRKAVHHACYEVMFSREFLSRTDFDYDRYCYYFDRHFEYDDELPPLYQQLVVQINHWKDQQGERDVRLTREFSDDGVEIVDTRFETPAAYRLTGAAAAVYRECDDHFVAMHDLIDRLAREGVGEAEVNTALAQLDELRLTWRDEALVLGLATDARITEERAASRWKQRWKGLYV